MLILYVREKRKKLRRLRVVHFKTNLVVYNNDGIIDRIEHLAQCKFFYIKSIPYRYNVETDEASDKQSERYKPEPVKMQYFFKQVADARKKNGNVEKRSVFPQSLCRVIQRI